MKGSKHAISPHTEQAKTDVWGDFLMGDREAFASLFEEYYPLLFSYGYRFSPQRNLLNDVLQDFFVELWKRKENLSPLPTGGQIKAYLLVSFRRKLLKILRKSEVNVSFMDRDVYHNPHVDADPSIEEQIIRVQTDQRKEKTLQEALNLLSRRQREAVYMRFYLEKDYVEIAQVMGIEVQSVYNLIQTSLKRLRTHLSKSDIFSCDWLLIFLVLEPFLRNG